MWSVEMSYLPPSVRAELAAAMAANATMTRERFLEERAARKAAEEAARAPRNVGAVHRYEPGGAAAGPGGIARARRSSSVRRRRARRVTMGPRRLRVNLNTGAGVNEEHQPAVEPTEYHNTRGASYRVTRKSPALANARAIDKYAELTRKKALARVMANRAEATSVNAAKLLAINAALADLDSRASLNASNAMAIAAIGEHLRELMEDTE